MSVRITRRLEFDAGHRIPNHASQCRHLHGHRYAIEVTLSGEVRSANERRHTGGKNGVAYDHQVNARHLTLTIAESRPDPARTGTERRHTGGKNGVTYDHRVDDRGVLLEVSSTDVGSTSAETLLKAALAGLGS